MEQSKLEFFMQMRGRYFPAEKIHTIRETLEKADESKANMLNMTKFKSTTSVVLFALFLGGFGVDRFITGSNGIGALKIGLWILATITSFAGQEVPALMIVNLGVTVFFIVEIFTASKRAKEYNYKKFTEVVDNPY